MPHASHFQIKPMTFTVDVFDDRAMLYDQGSTVGQTMLIDTGLVCLRHALADGREIVIDLLGAGDVLGNLTPQRVWLATEQAQALGPVHVTRLPAQSTPETLVQINHALIAREARLKQRLISQVSEPVETRLIKLLRCLAQQFNTRCTHGYSLEILLTQQEIADMVCASRPVVSQALNRFKQNNWLDYTAQKICLNESALEN
jgi:CRP/FNR family cyclic AMP-dependent transcriptional regulator